MDNKNRFLKNFLILSTVFVFGTGLGYLIAYLTGLRPNIIPLVSSILGIIIAFALPIWQALFFNAPCLSVEISSIRRIVSDNTVISIDDYPELAVLKPVVKTRSYSSFSYYAQDFLQLDFASKPDRGKK